MPLISDTITNLVGGVSQQAENLRFSNTASSIENAYLSPVVGMQKRQPAEWLGEMYEFGTTTAPTFTDRAAVHFINRDDTEHYCLVVDADGIRAFDADTGAAIECVVDAEAAAYLVSDGDEGVAADLSADLRFATVADTTFIANRNVTVQGSTASEFLSHHFAAFPQLAYDQDRGGAGVNGDFRATDTSTATTYRLSVPDFTANEEKYIRLSESADSEAAVFIKVNNSNNYDTGHYDIAGAVRASFKSDTDLQPAGDGILFVPSNNAKYRVASNSQQGAANYILEALDIRSGQTETWEQRSARELFLGRHVSTTFHESGTSSSTVTSATVSTSFRSYFDFSLTVVRAQTFGPNGTKSTLFGRTITHDIKIQNGVVLIGENDGAGNITYRQPLVNDHATAKIYDGAARRPHTTPDIDFNNAATSANASTYVTSTTGTYPGGSVTVDLFNSTFMPSHASQLALLNDLLWVIALHRGDDTQTSGNPKNLSDAYAPSSVGPVAGDGFTFSTLVEGSTTNQFGSFQDLPGTISGGVVYQVGGVEVADSSYYVIGYDGPSTDDERYIETYERPFVLDEATLPVKVQRTFASDGNPQFMVSLHQYTPRVVGDDTSNAVPSFVGAKINDVFVHGGRLGFVADENLILSGTDYGEMSNFFRSTVTQLLDSDRIDISMSTGRVDVLQSAVPFANTLMLMSDRAQFRLVAPNALTPATALLQQAASIEASKRVRPLAVGTKVFFPQDNVDFSTCMEITSEVDTAIIDAEEITAQTPRYIPSGVHTLAGAQKKQMLFALTHAAPNSIFVYKFFEADRNRLQSAWSKWTLADGTKIIGADVIEDHLHLVVEVTSSDYVAALESSAGLSTSFGTTSSRAYMLRVKLEEVTNTSNTDFPVLLDMKVPRSACVTVEGGRTPATGNAHDPLGAEFPISTGGAVGPGVDWTAIELPYRTDATAFSTVLTDSESFGITVPSITLTPLKLASNVTLAQFEAAQAAFVLQATLDANSAATTTAYNDLAALIDSTMTNTRAITYGRLDGVFATEADRVVNNITTAVVPDFTIGVDYTLAYTQSPIFFKPQGAETGRSENRLQLRYATVTYADTAGFTCEITPKGRQKKEYVFGALQTGDADVLLGQQAFATGSFRFPIFAKNDAVEVTFTNDGPFPSTLTTLEWQGMISPKSVQA